MATHLTKGRHGEEIAAQYLQSKGFQVWERNWRHKKVELDIIGEQDGAVVFVEVKTRKNKEFGNPEDAVDEKKQESLYKAALEYIREHEIDREVRFDIVAIVLSEQKEQSEIHHIKDAFFPDND